MRLFAILALFAAVVWAADVTGKWKAEYEMGGQTRTTTFDLKADGAKLTGTVEGGRGGPAEIQDGKISGDEISFVVIRKFQDREMKMQYKGVVQGNELKLKVGAGERQFEMTAKKQ
ncbi:MAG: hypothetical protein ACE15B_02360 [Bryobacteraceae bacterium]